MEALANFVPYLLYLIMLVNDTVVKNMITLKEIQGTNPWISKKKFTTVLPQKTTGNHQGDFLK